MYGTVWIDITIVMCKTMSLDYTFIFVTYISTDIKLPFTGVDIVEWYYTYFNYLLNFV